MSQIADIIRGSFFKNEDFMLSFFNQVKDETNVIHFLLDYKGDTNSKSLIPELDNLFQVLCDIDLISLIKTKGYDNKFIINESKEKFIFETEYIFKRKENMKSKKLKKPTAADTFNRINQILGENLGDGQLTIMKEFFKHLAEINTITDMEMFEEEFRPVGGKKLIELDEVIDVMMPLTRSGVIKFIDKKKGKTIFRIQNTDITFTTSDVGFGEHKEKTKRNNMSSRKGKTNKQVTNKKPAVKAKPFELTDKEIEDRALSVINSAKANSTEEVINIFEQISLPFNGGNFKRKLFEKIFELAEVNGEWRDDIGYVVFSKKRTTRTVVSHMDLISPFNRGFAKGRVYKIEEDKLIGALDNTFTNAVVINSMLNNLSNETTYLFTLDEETSQHAIRDYMKLFGTEQFIINLDITNEGMKNNMAIEYDEPSWEICKQIEKNMDSPFFTKNRVCDDMDEVVKANGFGFSYCVPSGKSIHSYNNYTYLNKIKPYIDGLDFLIHDLCLDCYDHNIKYIGINKALKCSSLKKLIKKDKRKPVKSKYGGSSRDTGYSTHDNFDREYHGGNYGGMQTVMEYDGDDDETSLPYDKEVEVNTAMTDMIMYICEETNPEQYQLFEGFVGGALFQDSLIPREEILLHSNQKTLSVLRETNLLVQMNDDKYVFNKDYYHNTRFKLLQLAIQKAPKIDFIKFAKLLANSETRFSLLEMSAIHLEKDIPESQKHEDFMNFIKAALTLSLIDNEKGYFVIT